MHYAAVSATLLFLQGVHCVVGGVTEQSRKETALGKGSSRSNYLRLMYELICVWKRESEH